MMEGFLSLHHQQFQIVFLLTEYENKEVSLQLSVGVFKLACGSKPGHQLLALLEVVPAQSRWWRWPRNHREDD